MSNIEDNDTLDNLERTLSLGLDDKYDEVKQLIDMGKEKGYLLYDEVNDLLPSDVTSSDELDDMFSIFRSQGIEVVDGEPKAAGAEKLGYDTEITAVHPFASEQRLPIYVANFVLMGYGTGAIFGCPAHDQRDLEFARKYELPVRPVVIHATHDKAHTLAGYFRYTADGTLISETRSVGIRIYKVGHWGSAGSLGQVTHHDRSNSKT